MQIVPDITTVNAKLEDVVLSPESYVYVALMSVEEGPNNASFLQPYQHVVPSLGAFDTALSPAPAA